MKKLFAFLLACFCAAAFAGGATFLDSKGYAVPALPQADTDKIGAMKVDDRYKNAKITPIALNAAALDSGVITFTTPEGKTFEYVGQKKGNTWIGKSTTSGTAIISVVNNTVAGTILEGGRIFGIQRLNDSTHLLIESTPRDMIEGPDPKFIGPGPSAPPSSPAMKALNVRPLAVGDPTIRVLNVYTPVAYYILGNTPSALEARNAEILSKVNTIFANSGVHLNVSDAGYMLLSLSSTEFNGIPMSSQIAHMKRNTPILVQRDITSADVVMLITAKEAGGPDGLSDAIIADAAHAFAAVDVYSVNGGSGTPLTYAHEFGHLLGGRHAASGTVANDSTNSPDADAHGWWVRSAQSGLSDVCFHTVMSYNSNNNGVNCSTSPYDEWAPYYSNPSVYYRTKLTGSTGTANEARVLNYYGPNVTSFGDNTKLAPKQSAKFMAAMDD